ncbi:Single hybrid motif [Moorella glycerini]|uniref:Glutaconyl-CoA decarboxylase subunit gamma n=1 Tax=Neomoorella stamsii TaxID=1266720 RepID=A0A9X7P5D9_9FIRM|nr:MULTISPECIES: biotin/lipoyl-containing protein [Moorella]PRR71413.1 Glutaconyl-CoA decarboxylase subunit gamma [Moorella stamsii]CEP68622.1 Single hybrid motif [Moorella glycerini]
MKRHFQVTVNGETFSVEVEEVGGTVEHLRPAVKPPAKKASPVHQAGLSPRAPLPQDNRTVTSPLPGTVVEVRVKPGQKVTAGQVLLIIEAMKMENEIQAPAGGVVQEVMVQTGTNVASGQPLVKLG